MRLLLIRHGETVDNVAGIYAGIRDSPLTTHGVLQASRLASHLATSLKISNIFSSDLQRASKTAESIRLAQSTAPSETVKLELLREQDFGYYEGRTFLERQKGSDKSGKDVHGDIHADEHGFQDVESKESMKLRVNLFIDLHLVDHLLSRADDETLVVVAHGIILSYLWRAILRRFDPPNISLGSGVAMHDGRGLYYLGGWSNTGVLDLEIKKIPIPSSLFEPEPRSGVDVGPVVSSSSASTLTSDGFPEAHPPDSVPKRRLPNTNALPSIRLAVDSVPASTSTSKLANLSLVVKAVNCQAHLRGLKKTRGGIGSAKHDDKQQTVDSFFKKRKIE
jgi:broad specificity phosphatase PhoE